MRTKLVLWFYLCVGVFNIALGLIYFFSKQFLSYHAQAVGTPWQDVDFGTQTLILALMKVAGGGWVALGFFTIILAVAALKSGSTVARWALPAGTLIFYSASFAATWSVYQATGAPTPWQPSLAMIALAPLALFIDAPWAPQVRPKNHK